MVSPKSFKFEGWSILLTGPHMKSESDFVKEVSTLFEGDKSKAKEAWKAAQELLKSANEKEAPAVVSEEVIKP